MTSETIGVDWLAIVETQQQELEDLRAQLEHRGPGVELPRSVHSAFAISPTRSSRSSRSSAGSYADQAVPLDLQRYAKVCADLEQLQHKATSAEIHVHELVARESRATQEIDRYREAYRESESRVRCLELELTREEQSKNEAIERVVHVMLESEELTIRLTEAVAKIASLDVIIASERDRVQELERAERQRMEATQNLHRRVEELDRAFHQAEQESEQLRQELLRERETQAQTQLEYVKERESERESELKEKVCDLQRVLHVQTAQLERQQQAIVELDAAKQRLVAQVEGERLHFQHQYAHQMEAMRVLQSIVDHTNDAVADLRLELAQSRERGLMQLEEMAAYASWRKTSLRREARRDEEQAELLSSREKLEKDVRQSEASRRKVIMELADARRQVDHMRAAMQHVDSELQRMTKTFSSFRTRETNVTRALREYGRRNRILHDAVKLMRTKVLQLTQSLKRSEKRKDQATEAAQLLKRGLVIERCQREDLLIQCTELEQCMFAFQKVACESVERTHSMEKENAVLQHAVKQLCAYSAELSHSQQALQEELSRLEVHGQRELNVFG